LVFLFLHPAYDIRSDRKSSSVQWRLVLHNFFSVLSSKTETTATVSASCSSFKSPSSCSVHSSSSCACLHPSSSQQFSKHKTRCGVNGCRRAKIKSTLCDPTAASCLWNALRTTAATATTILNIKPSGNSPSERF